MKSFPLLMIVIMKEYNDETVGGSCIYFFFRNTSIQDLTYEYFVPN